MNLGCMRSNAAALYTRRCEPEFRHRCVLCSTLEQPSARDSPKAQESLTEALCVQLTFSEKGLRKLMDGVKLFQSALADKAVLDTLLVGSRLCCYLMPCLWPNSDYASGKLAACQLCMRTTDSPAIRVQLGSTAKPIVSLVSLT